MAQVTWSDITSRLTEAKVYWLGTTSRNGAPDASPVWGAVRDDALYFYSERSTVKARNIARDPRVLLHLESGSDVVIVHGKALDIGNPTQHPEVARPFERKYTQAEELPYLPLADPCFDVMYRLEPTRALTWVLPDTEASTACWHANS